MDTLPASKTDIASGQATYGMANLRSKTTGLPFVVYISQRDDIPHDVRVKVSAGPRVRPDEMGSYSLRPFRHRSGPPLGGSDERLLEQWIAANREVIQSYWDGDIAFTEDAIDRIVSI